MQDVHSALQPMTADTDAADLVRANIVGVSAAMRDLRGYILRLSQSEAPILIEGEPGTGKELAARAIHYSSRRQAGPFVGIGCGALSEESLLAELFGGTEDQATSGSHNWSGLIAAARHGTLFLDQVDALSPRCQAAILQLLQKEEHDTSRRGNPCYQGLRIICASNRRLDRLVHNGSFRADLYYRIQVIEIRLPPLREYADDIARLSGHFIATIASATGEPEKGLHPATSDWMQHYNWPGNVRELEQMLHRSFILTRGATLEIPDRNRVGRSHDRTRLPAAAQPRASAPGVSEPMSYCRQSVANAGYGHNGADG